MRSCCQTGGYYAGPLHQTGGVYSGARFQRGGQLRGFAGPEYQVGGRWNFGSFLWRHAKPLLSFLGRKALKTGVGIGQDVIEGRNAKEAAKERLTEAGQEIAATALDRVKRKIQTGKGTRKRKAMKRATLFVSSLRRRRSQGVRRKRRKGPRRSAKRQTRSRRSRVKTIFDR